MGIRSYFKPSARASKEVVVEEKPAQRENNADGSTATPKSVGSSKLSSNLDLQFIDSIKYEVILNYLFQRQCSSMWIEDHSGAVEGVVVRKHRAHYTCCPPALSDSPFTRTMAALNVQAAMTVKSRVITTFLSWSPNAQYLPIRDGLRIQVVPTMQDLIQARKHQYAAFVASDSLLIVWDDDPSNLVRRVEAIEADLLKLVWMASQGTLEDELEDNVAYGEKSPLIDEESGLPVTAKRPVLYYNAILVAISVCLLTVMMGTGYGKVAREVLQLHTYVSLAFVALTPINMFLTLFMASVVVSSIAQLVGPVRHLTRNSKFFSAHPPPRIQIQDLPHITIQCPVYKEGLASVIAPTIRSVKKAISTYELQGGTANIFVNDDGLQLIGEKARQERIEFYTDNDIGWVARPKHNEKGFVRKGKFKKASNMNHALAVSNAVEGRLQAVDRHENWTQRDEDEAYEACLEKVLNEDFGDETWAQGNIRMGDYILLVDSDTRIPSDCLLDAGLEMELSPEVAIIQFSSGVMQVAHDFFENAVTFFTNMIYTAIRFGVASGDVAPFVGHNAILRWSALQEVAFLDENGTERFWSESSVSEDFDMALRLQVEGYIVRLAAWAGDGFKEGVSLTVYDELTRWEKYAYGCSELVFNPLRVWLWKGPFTPLFRRFVFSCMPLGSKINIISYIGTYYAIGSAWIMTLTNYVAVGLYNGYLDKWYVESWKIWISIIMVFTVAGNVALAVQRYRLGEKPFLSAFYENFKWCLMFIIMFGGMSLHISQALLCHMFSINMHWEATAKEVEESNFFIEVPKVAKKFKWSMTLPFLMIAGMVIMAKGTFIPWSWNITQFVAIFPLAMLCACHILLPIALNPGLMTFKW